MGIRTASPDFTTCQEEKSNKSSIALWSGSAFHLGHSSGRESTTAEFAGKHVHFHSFFICLSAV